MAKAKSAISIGISALVVILLILIVGFGIFLDNTFNTASTNHCCLSSEQTSITPYALTTSSVLTTSAATATGCLLELPSGATFTEFTNATVVGTVVTYSNGTRIFFDAAKCPQPLSSQAYNVAYRVVTDPRFIAEENGTVFLPALTYEFARNSGVSGSGKNVQYTELTFVQYSNPPNPLVKWCNGSYVPNSFATTRYYETKELYVMIPYNAYNSSSPNAPPDNIDSLNFTAMSFGVSTAQDMLDGFGCTSTVGTTISTDTSGNTVASTTYSSLAESQTVLPVTCCITLPQSFVVGSYSFKDYVYAPPPPTIINGTTRYQSAGVLLIFQVISASTSQNVSFSWGGTFSETAPSPSSATAFNGRVNFQWYSNITGLYVKIATFSGGSTSSQSNSQQTTGFACTTSTTTFVNVTVTQTATECVAG